MRKLLTLSLVILLQGCADKDESTDLTELDRGEIYQGVVLETIEVDNYTYLQVESDQGTAWIATSLVWVNQGDKISFPEGMLMQNFHSEALDRTFESLLFVDRIEIVGTGTPGAPGPESGQALPEGHPDISYETASISGQAADETGAAPGETMTIAEIYGAYPTIAGQKVQLSGEVIKFNSNIMGTNWIRMQDGTGTAPENTLLVTSNADAAIGSSITVSGTVRTDVNLGSGYNYKVLVGNAEVSH